MKIIHCADLHLASKMTTNLSKEKAKERKVELQQTFLRMVDYAKEQKIKAIIIAGDMFDSKYISKHDYSLVAEAITRNPDILFFYLKGNHDSEACFLSSLEEIPQNLLLFSDEWQSYTLPNTDIKISGVELTRDNAHLIYSALSLDAKCFNIVILHGQLNEYQAKNDAQVIDISSLRNKNIDYLALGHVHQYKSGELLPRGKYCYPGCLEGRGFDECGEHGFVVLDIDEETHKLTITFKPFAYRKLYEIPVDISDADSTLKIKDRIEERLKEEDCSEKDLLKIVLTGECDVNGEKNIDLLLKELSDNYYFIKIDDKSTTAINYADYALNTSLKGEFVRQVQHDSVLTDKEKAEIIRCGFQVLNGEEIEL